MNTPIELEPSEQTLALASFAARLRLEDVPPDVIQHTLRVVRDTLGTILAGSTLPEVRGLASLAPTLAGPGKATLIGFEQTASPNVAALVNGTGGVSLELDEGNQFAINHPSVHILPATLALAEEQGASGAEFLAAFIAGYEVAVRVGRATRLRQAVHPFGTHAIVGAAAASSKLLGLTTRQTAQALELAAGLMIASSQTAANSGASVRNLFTGFTNHNGLLAAMLVKAGFSGEPNAMSRVYGHVLGDHFLSDNLGDDPGKEFYITRNYFKIHACSRWNHAPIEATARLLDQSPFLAEHVESIIVWTYDPATRLSGNHVTNGYAAKHSIPYNVAARIVHGTNDLQAFEPEAVNDGRLQSLLTRISVQEDPALTKRLPDVRPARVEITLHSGEVLTEAVERPRGGFDNPLSEDELLGKFMALARMALPEDAVERLAARILTLPEMDDLDLLSQLLKGSPA